MLKFGQIELDMPFIQAALSGYTEAPMRLLGRRFGCPLVFTGVMLDKLSLHKKAIRQPKFQPHPDEHPVAAQIMGEDPETLAASAGVFRRMGYDLIDLNFACPAPKVLRRGRGGWLMQKPEVVREAYNRVREAAGCPVFMKLRIGYDGSEASRDDFWRIIENAAADGADMVAVHGRVVNQRYKGKADWEVIAEVKRRFPRLCLFGSGDIMTAETAIGRLRESGADGIVIARGCVGNPWIFPETRALWEGREKPAGPSLEEMQEVMLSHFGMIQVHWPKRTGVAFFRKFIPGYCRRHPERKATMLALLAAQTPEELVETIQTRFC